MASIETQKPQRVLIMGAAGRDFHNFLQAFKNNNLYRVKAFTAKQIPGIHHRSFPKVIFQNQRMTDSIGTCWSII